MTADEALKAINELHKAGYLTTAEFQTVLLRMGIRPA